MQILDSNEDLRTDLAKRYIRTLSQIIQCLLELKQFDEAKEHILQLEQLSQIDGFDTPDATARMQTELVLSNLKKYIHTAKFCEGASAMSSALELIKPEDSTLHKEIALRMYYYMAYLHFGAGEHNKALHWLNRVINDNENDLRQDLYGYARLFNIVLHYELGNNDLLEYTIKSTARYLQKRSRDFEMEKLVLDQFKKLIRLRTVASKKEQFIDFQEKLKELARNEDGKALLRYFDFSTWIQCKLENCSFEDAMKQRL
jgi:tetratricopeptide (TPR) repeat protein